MELHVFGGERETETHTGTRLATARGGAAVEPRWKRSNTGSRSAGGIPGPESSTATCCVGEPGNRDPYNPSTVRLGILDEIPHGGLDASLVQSDVLSRDARVNLHWGVRREGADCLGDQFVNPCRFQGEVGHPSVQPGDLQEILDQAPEPLDVGREKIDGHTGTIREFGPNGAGPRTCRGRLRHGQRRRRRSPPLREGSGSRSVCGDRPRRPAPFARTNFVRSSWRPPGVDITFRIVGRRRNPLNLAACIKSRGATSPQVVDSLSPARRGLIRRESRKDPQDRRGGAHRHGHAPRRLPRAQGFRRQRPSRAASPVRPVPCGPAPVSPPCHPRATSGPRSRATSGEQILPAA